MRLLRSQLVAPVLTVICFGVGSAFLVSGVIPRVFGETKSAEAAAKQYTSTWTAKRVIRAQWGGVCLGNFGGCTTFQTTYTNVGKSYPWNNNYINESLSGRTVSIGVAEWEVKGQVPSNGTYFKETWAIPGSMGLDVRFEKTYSGFGGGNDARKVTSVSPDTVNLKQFLIGISDQSYAVRFFTTAAPTGGPGGVPSGTQFGNGASSCNGSGGETGAGGQMGSFCITSTGSYGWYRGKAGSDVGGGSNFVTYTADSSAAGTFMPLSWTVTGNVCDKATDPECK